MAVGKTDRLVSERECTEGNDVSTVHKTCNKLEKRGDD